jgi:hypothetical protein
MREIINKTINIKNIIFAMPAEAAAIPEKPNIAAMKAIIKNKITHPSIKKLPFYGKSNA